MKIEVKSKINGIDKLKRPENVFAIFSILIGTIFLFIFPPFSAPDELGHFAKPYAFSEGLVVPVSNGTAEKTGKTWMTIGFYLPKGIVDLYQNSESIIIDGSSNFDYSTLRLDKFEESSPTFTYLGGQTSYSFVQYIPQILGISLGKLLSNSALLIYFMSKTVNLIIYIIFIYLAIKISKFTKWGIVILGLNPLALQLAASSSGDGFTIASTFLFVALMTRLIIREKQVKNYEIIPVLLFQVLLVQMKPTLIVFGLLFFLIPNEIFSIRKKICFGSITILVSICWYYLWSKLFPSNDYIYKDYAIPSEQTKFILENPIDFIRACIRTIRVHSVDLFHGYSGKFAWLNRPVDIWVSILYILTVLFSILLKDLREIVKISFLVRIFSIILLVLFILLNFLALYQIWSLPGSNIISGLQGRYFIPVATVGILILAPNRIKVKHNVGIVVLTLSMVFIFVNVLFSLLNSYGLI